MQKNTREIHFDFHTLPGISDFGSEFNAIEFAKMLKEANVTRINAFARCNIGFSYYKTNVGTVYPQMKGDMLREIISACHSEGIGVTAYLNGGLNHELCLSHPEYMKINRQGESCSGDKINSNFFRTPCFNTGYREYLLSEIKEILSLEPDGIFCDCMIPRCCYCPDCMKKMKDNAIDTADDNAVYKFAVDTLLEVFAEIRRLIPADKRFYINSFPYEMIHDILSHAELECLPTDGEWGYDYFGVQAPYYRNFSSERVYMTGRFVGGWGDFGGVKSKASLENDAFDALMQGYGISVGDHMHPRGCQSAELFKDIKEIFSNVKSLENYTQNAQVLSDVCVLRNKTTAENLRNVPTDSDRGVCRMLSELKICYDVKDEDMDLSGYRLLVLPDETEITDKLCDKLESFGGAVLGSGKSIKNGSIWSFIDSIKDDKSSECYYDLGDGEVRACYQPCVLLESKYSVADYIEPYFSRVWDGRHGYFYTPPKHKTKYCAVAKKGSVAHICFDIFKSYYRFGAAFHKSLVSYLINSLVPDRLILTDDLPSSSRVSLQKSGEGKLLMIKTTFPEMRGGKGIIEEHTALPAGREISVAGQYSSVCTQPEGKKVQCSAEGDYTRITLPEIYGFGVFLLK